MSTFIETSFNWLIELGAFVAVSAVVLVMGGAE